MMRYHIRPIVMQAELFMTNAIGHNIMDTYAMVIKILWHGYGMIIYSCCCSFMWWFMPGSLCQVIYNMEVEWWT